LKGQTEINVVLDFSELTYDGDSQKEQYEDKGNNWVEEWEGKRRVDLADNFISNLNDELKKVDVSFGEYPNAEYTLIVVVLDCDFGAFAGPMSVPAKVKASVKIVKTGSTEVLSSTKKFTESQNPYSAIATPNDFVRMYLAFGELGEELGEKLVKILK
jgi:hypothetical protein